MGVTRPLRQKELTARKAMAENLEKKMARERFSSRRTISERVRRRGHVHKSVPSLTGIDSRGSYIQISRAQDLKLEFLKNGLLCMGTGLEKGWAGKRIIGGVPQRESTLDIYSATRRAMHIREGLEMGRIWRDEALPEIEKINSKLYNLWDWGSPLWFYSYRRVIDSLKDALKNTINPLKQEARDMLGKASELLGRVSTSPNLSEKRKWSAAACSCLTAFRNRIGPWRDSQVEGMIAYNKMRERYLRAERDWRVHRVLRRLVKAYSIEKKWAILGRDTKDLRYAVRMEEIASSKAKREKKTKAIGELTEEMDENKYNRGGRGLDLAVLDEAENCYLEGKNKRGRTLLRRGALILKLDKPGFVAGQLREAEHYVQPVAEKIEDGARHLEQIPRLPGRGQERAEALGTAVECFKNALWEMEAIKR
ncbi:hypothetical protein GF415_01815 [Candidatus Micrarchaeota archaeon]|nr:hypothetical protein [Candidatus Micrarchaeota archaeon]